MQKLMTIAALVFSVIAIAVSVWTYQQADARAERALERREKALVEEYRPEVERLCDDFGVVGPQDPQTLDQLFRPLFKLATDVSN